MKTTIVLFAMLIYNGILAQEATLFNSYETLGDLQTIQISDNLCVVLYPTDFYGVSIKADKRLKDLIKADLQNGVLKIYTSKESVLAAGAEITVYVKDFKTLRLLGDVWVQSERKIMADSFNIQSNDNSAFNLTVACKNFNLNASSNSRGSLFLDAETISMEIKGTSKLYMKLSANAATILQSENTFARLEGKTKSLNAEIGGTSQLSSEFLIADDVYLNSSNSNEIIIYAKNRFKVNGRGSAKIYVKGNPQKIDTIGMNKNTEIIY